MPKLWCLHKSSVFLFFLVGAWVDYFSQEFDSTKMSLLSSDFWGCLRIHSGKLTWNPKMEIWKMISFSFLIGWSLGSMLIFRGVYWDTLFLHVLSPFPPGPRWCDGAQGGETTQEFPFVPTKPRKLDTCRVNIFQGSLDGTHLRVIKQCQCRVNLRDFRKIIWVGNTMTSVFFQHSDLLWVFQTS